MKLELDELNETDRLVDIYLNNLKNRYGDKFFLNITKLLGVIASSPTPMTIKEIVYFMGYDCIDFRLLSWINDIRGFLSIDRSYRDNLVSIYHDEIKNYLNKNLEIISALHPLISQIATLITDKTYNIDISNDGETLFLSNFWNYCKPYGEKKLFLDDEVLKKLINILEKKEYRKQTLLLDRMTSFYTQIELLFEYAKNNNISLNTNNLAISYMNRGVAYWSQNQHDKAIEDYNKSIEIMKFLSKDESINFDINNLASAYMRRGVTYYSIKQLDRAIKDFDKSIKIRKTLSKDKSINFDINDLAEVYMHRGLAYWSKNELEKALKDYNKSIEIRELLSKDESINFNINDLAKTYLNRGIIYRRKNQFEKALKDYNKSIEIREALSKDKSINFDMNSLAISYMNRGNVYNSQKLYDKAIDDYNKSIEIREALSKDKSINFDMNSLAISYMNRGNVYNSQKLYDKVINDYNKFLDIIFKELEKYLQYNENYAKLLFETYKNRIYSMLEDYEFLKDKYTEKYQFFISQFEEERDVNLIRFLLHQIVKKLFNGIEINKAIQLTFMENGINDKKVISIVIANLEEFFEKGNQ